MAMPRDVTWPKQFFAYNWPGKHFNPTSCGVIWNQRSKIRRSNIFSTAGCPFRKISKFECRVIKHARKFEPILHTEGYVLAQRKQYHRLSFQNIYVKSWLSFIFIKISRDKDKRGRGSLTWNSWTTLESLELSIYELDYVSYRIWKCCPLYKNIKLVKIAKIMKFPDFD